MDGWIRSYRKMFDNPVVCKDADHYAVWGYLLHYAAHEPYDVMFNGKRITLKPGELITSRYAIAHKFSISESKVQRILKTFEIERQIELQATRHGRLIYIVNWNKYQKVEPQNEPQVNHKWTTSEPQVNANKNIKNVKNERIEEVNKLSSLRSDNSSITTDYEEVIRLWNELDGLGNIKGIKSISPGSKRLDNVRARLKTFGMDGFTEAIENIKKSSFLQGNNAKGWTITFDWFVLPSNFPKVLEGNYNDKTDKEDWLDL